MFSPTIRQLCIGLIVTAALAFGQQPSLPSNFMAVGAAYNPYTRPGAAGWASYAHLIDTISGTYLFTTEDITSSSAKPYQIQTSVRVGIGTLLKDFNHVKLFGIVDGGGASSTISSGGAASGGTMITIQLTKDKYLIAGFRMIKIQGVSGTPKLYEFGYGWTW